MKIEDQKIVHQKQIDDKTCTSACIAMLTGRSIEEIIKDFHEDFLDDKIYASSYLQAQGFKVRTYPSEVKNLVYGFVYLLAVPSLNIPGGLHSIIADIREKDKDPVIYDPQEGREGKKFYKWKDADGDGYPVKGFVIDAEIIQ